MKRLAITTLSLMLLLALAVPASAGGRQNPLQTCRGLYDTREQFNPGTGQVEVVNAYWVPMTFADGSTEDFPIQNLAGCITTVRRAGGQLPVPYTALSTPAYNAQCRYLETEFGITYPYDFYGNPAYHAEGRGDCIYFLRSFHLGLLPPGPPGGGQ